MAKQCPECGFDSLETKKTVENNEVIEGGWYCPNCEATFDSDVAIDWDDIDFPVWIGYESYNDTWEMWREFKYSTNFYDGDYNREAPRDMKYTTFTVWFKVNEYGSVEGPYDEKEGELI